MQNAECRIGPKAVNCTRCRMQMQNAECRISPKAVNCTRCRMQMARGPHTHNDYQSRLRVKVKTAPLQNGFCKTAPQRYETAQMQSRGGKDTMCVCVAVD